MSQTCTVTSLVVAGEKLAPLSRSQLTSILLYVMAKYLAALGGTDYTSDFGTLLTAAKNWPRMNEKQNIAGLIEILIATANGHSAGISTDVTSLVAASKYLQHAEVDKEALLLFLSCAIGAKL